MVQNAPTSHFSKFSCRFKVVTHLKQHCNKNRDWTCLDTLRVHMHPREDASTVQGMHNIVQVIPCLQLPGPRLPTPAELGVPLPEVLLDGSAIWPPRDTENYKETCASAIEPEPEQLLCLMPRALSFPILVVLHCFSGRRKPNDFTAHLQALCGAQLVEVKVISADLIYMPSI